MTRCFLHCDLVHNRTAFNDVDNWHRAAFYFIRNAELLRFSRKQNLREPYRTVRFIDSRGHFPFSPSSIVKRGKHFNSPGERRKKKWEKARLIIIGRVTDRGSLGHRICYAFLRANKKLIPAGRARTLYTSLSLTAGVSITSSNAN